MDVLIHLFVGLHIIGIAALLGGFLTQMKAMGAGTARYTPAMLHGALTMLVTGVILVGLNQADDQTVNNIKIGVKLALLIVILGLVYVKRDDEKVDKGLFALVGALTAANVFIAVLWTHSRALCGPGGLDVAEQGLPVVASEEWPSGSPGRPGC
jgi:peptidoglycan/LPS O-acetylase OafA/YrhL